jgi:hypothetical protein
MRAPARPPRRTKDQPTPAEHPLGWRAVPPRSMPTAADVGIRTVLPSPPNQRTTRGRGPGFPGRTAQPAQAQPETTPTRTANRGTQWCAHPAPTARPRGQRCRTRSHRPIFVRLIHKPAPPYPMTRGAARRISYRPDHFLSAKHFGEGRSDLGPRPTTPHGPSLAIRTAIPDAPTPCCALGPPRTPF